MPPSLLDLDAICNMVVSKHALALSEHNEATRMRELYKVDVHHDEGANLLVDKLRGQLKNVEATLQKTKDSMV